MPFLKHISIIVHVFVDEIAQCAGEWMGQSPSRITATLPGEARGGYRAGTICLIQDPADRMTTLTRCNKGTALTQRAGAHLQW